MQHSKWRHVLFGLSFVIVGLSCMRLATIVQWDDWLASFIGYIIGWIFEVATLILIFLVPFCIACFGAMYMAYHLGWKAPMESLRSALEPF